MLRRRQKNKQDSDAMKIARAEAEKVSLSRPVKRKPGRPRKVRHEHIDNAQG